MKKQYKRRRPKKNKSNITDEDLKLRKRYIEEMEKKRAKVKKEEVDKNGNNPQEEKIL
jgi:hypothetical protein